MATKTKTKKPRRAAPPAADTRKVVAFALRTLATNIEAGEVSAVILACEAAPGGRLSDPCIDTAGTPNADKDTGNGYVYTVDIAACQPQSTLLVGLAARISAVLRL